MAACGAASSFCCSHLLRAVCHAGDKVVVICNPHDTWFSQRSWEEMWFKIPTVKVSCIVLSHVIMLSLQSVCSGRVRQHVDLQAYMEDAQRHDFCVSAKLSASLAQKSAEIMQDVLSHTS